MATIDSKAVIDAIIAGNGYSDPSWEAEGEPPAIKIVEYTNGWGKTTWGVVFANEGPIYQSRYEEATEYVRNPRVIWTRRVNGPTDTSQ